MKALHGADFFEVAEDDLELQAISGPSGKMESFPPSSQRKIVEKDWNGPVRVLGGSARGKPSRLSTGPSVVQSVLK